MSNTYRYPALPGEESIRVLQLLPGNGDEPLKCELIPICLSDSQHLKYEALSYVWGDENPAFFIECKNGRVKITRNCHEALQHLRLQQQPRTLWIDAICIDQSSNAERSHQVGLMGEIYSNAGVVIGWLGPTSKHSVATMRIIGMLAIMELFIAPTILISSWLYEVLRDTLYSLARFCHNCLRKSNMYDYEPETVLSHIYHTRHWTAQEMILARRHYFLLGYSKLSRWCLLAIMMQQSSDKADTYDRIRVRFLYQMSFFTQVVKVIPRILRDVIGAPVSEAQGIANLMVRGFFFPMKPISTETSSGPDATLHNFIQIVRAFWLRDLPALKLGLQNLIYSVRRKNLDTSPGNALALILHGAQTAGVKNDLDRVFAVRAVLQNFGASLPKGDYSETVEQKYEAATTGLMEWLNTIDTLIFACCEPIGPLPSWVIDWRKHPIPVSPLSPLAMPERMLRLPGRLLPESHKTQYEAKDGQLALTGSSIASIVTISEAFPPLRSKSMEADAFREREKDYIHAWQDWSRVACSDDIFSALSELLSPENIGLSFSSSDREAWNLLMGHLSDGDLPEKYKIPCSRHPELTSNRSSRESLLYHALVLHDDYSKLCDELERPEPGRSTTFLSKLILCLSETRLCTTSSSNLCLTNYSPRVGDAIVWFHGSSVPYIMRKVREPNTYKLVGYCYVYSYAVEAPEEDIFEYKSFDYCLV